MNMETSQEFIDAGAWLGRHEAFAVMATQCAAVQAQCLRKAKESGVYEKLGLTWDEFCKQYAGIGRSRADDLIRRHERFGDTYFRLSDLARISPSTFARLSEAGHVHDETLEFEGEQIPITPENAPQIRMAVQRLRSQLTQAQATPNRVSITSLQMQIESYVQNLAGVAKMRLNDTDRAALSGLMGFAIGKLRTLRAAFAAPRS